jgi:DNA-binding GntR family transcriptional regulator
VSPIATKSPRREVKTRVGVNAAKAGVGRVKTGPVDRSAVVDGEQKVSSADQIVAEILRGLYEGRYVAGQKLIESDLTRQFRVGRGSVREALQRLAAEGLVTVSLYKGASIRALSRTDVRDVLEVVEALAGLAARRAAERFNGPDDERILRATVTSLAAIAASGDTFEFGRMRNRFYRQLAQISGNRELARLLAMVQTHLIRVQFRSVHPLNAARQRLQDYERITDAILARDGATAERLIRQHIRGTARAIEKLPDQYFDQ